MIMSWHTSSCNRQRDMSDHSIVMYLSQDEKAFTEPTGSTCRLLWHPQPKVERFAGVCKYAWCRRTD